MSILVNEHLTNGYKHGKNRIYYRKKNVILTETGLLFFFDRHDEHWRVNNSSLALMFRWQLQDTEHDPCFQHSSSGSSLLYHISDGSKKISRYTEGCIILGHGCAGPFLFFLFCFLIAPVFFGFSSESESDYVRSLWAMTFIMRPGLDS